MSDKQPDRIRIGYRDLRRNGKYLVIVVDEDRQTVLHETSGKHTSLQAARRAAYHWLRTHGHVVIEDDAP